MWWGTRSWVLRLDPESNRATTRRARSERVGRMPGPGAEPLARIRMPRTVRDMSSEPTRRYRASDAPRPKIALTIERVISCAAALADSLADDVEIGVAQVARRAGRAIERSGGEDQRDATVDALVRHAVTAIGEARRDALAYSQAQGPVDTEADLARAARAAGLVDADTNAVKQLSGRRDKRSQQLLRAWRLGAVQQWAMSGALEQVLIDAWDEVDEDEVLGGRGALDAVIARHTARGIDAEGLAWDVIIAETNNHIGLVLLECNKLAPRYPGVDADDLKGFGWQGLRAALRGYDPHVAAFSTYACPRINGAIRDGLRAERPIPKRLTTLVNKVARAEEQLTQSLGRAPELKELAEQVGTTMEKMALLPRLGHTASVDEYVRNDDSDRATIPSWLADDTDPADGAVGVLRRERIEEALDELPADEAAAVRLLLLDGLAPGEAATSLGTTTRRLRASKKRGLDKLAELLADWAPVGASS